MWPRHERRTTIALVAIVMSAVFLINYVSPRAAAGSPNGPSSPPSMSNLESKYCLQTNGTFNGTLGFPAKFYYYSANLIPLSSGCNYVHYGTYLEIENLTSQVWTYDFIAINQTTTHTSNINITYSNQTVYWLKQVNQSGSFTLFDCNRANGQCTQFYPTKGGSPSGPSGCGSSTVGNWPWVYQSYTECATKNIEYYMVGILVLLIDAAIINAGTPVGWAIGIAALIVLVGLAYVTLADSLGNPHFSGIYTAAYVTRVCIFFFCLYSFNWLYLWGNPPP